jgi:hypothetical protein
MVEGTAIPIDITNIIVLLLYYNDFFCDVLFYFNIATIKKDILLKGIPKLTPNLAPLDES